MIEKDTYVYTAQFFKEGVQHIESGCLAISSDIKGQDFYDEILRGLKEAFEVKNVAVTFLFRAP